MARIAGLFGRVEPRATARVCLLGLLSGTERKSCRRPAEHAGPARPGPMQRLLRPARWDTGAVRDEVPRYVVDQPDLILSFHDLCLAEAGDEWFMGQIDTDGSVVCWASYGPDLAEAIRGL